MLRFSLFLAHIQAGASLDFLFVLLPLVFLDILSWPPSHVHFQPAND